ncbi:MAG: multicopper oxidase family protein [Nocardiaceae bacterium]|nr:multicopper oxidase family protein [Nocardiaceae bacterium]
MDRRQFLGLSAAAVVTGLLPGCSKDTPSGPRIGSNSQIVADYERKRRAANAAVAEVKLRAAATDVDLGGGVINTWTYNGGLPGPLIRVRKGDVIRATIQNDLPADTAIHWHGIGLRNDMDGVPGLTQEPIKPGSSFTYEFAVPDSGTHWFHPHLGTQLERGLYAPLIVDDPAEKADYDIDTIVIFDDWLKGDPDATLAGLKKNGMGGMDMPGMDHGSMVMPQSDVLDGDAADVTSYQGLLANGRFPTAPVVVGCREGQRVRLRIINAAADTAFRVGIPGQKMTVTHTDGFAVQPVEGDAVLLGQGERIDAIVTVKGVTRVIGVGEGRGLFAQLILYPEGAQASQDVPAMAQSVEKANPLRLPDFVAAESVRLASKSPDVTHDLVLGGPGSNYEWTINGIAFDHAKPLEGALDIKPGQRVRLNYRNDSTMFHPMHLHGHTFQVVNNGKPGARKDTAIVLPKQTLTVDFDATNPGQWVTHCHNVYHGESGMMSVLSYVES